MEESSKRTQARERFPTTRWSVVLEAQIDAEAEQSRADQALAQLCQMYWPPIYAYFKSRGCTRADAEDLTQDFFATLLSKEAFSTIEEAKGKLRTFLLVAAKRFLLNDRRKQRAEKRGGGDTPISIDMDGISDYLCDVNADEPDKVFDQQWALTLLRNVLTRLEAENQRPNRLASFHQLKGVLTSEDHDYAQLAEEMDLTQGAVRIAVHRLRRRYRELLSREIARTLEDGEAVEPEIRYLCAILSSVAIPLNR